MAPYIHHRILEIENYANQLQWVEKTLEDKDSTEVVVENTLIDLEKQLDEGSFLQVPKESHVPKESQVLEGLKYQNYQRFQINRHTKEIT